MAAITVDELKTWDADDLIDLQRVYIEAGRAVQQTLVLLHAMETTKGGKVAHIQGAEALAARALSRSIEMHIGGSPDTDEVEYAVGELSGIAHLFEDVGMLIVRESVRENTHYAAVLNAIDIIIQQVLDYGD